MVEEIIIDGENCVLGRLASYAAKQALNGKNIFIVNCEKIIITGKKQNILNKYFWKRSLGGDILKGPFFPSTPEKIVKRTIRGMLPYKQARGREALKRIKCYEGVPEQFKDREKINLERKKGLSIKKLSELIRGKNER